MNVSSIKYQPLLGALLALAIGGGAASVLAATQPYTVDGTPVTATEQPAPDAAGSNPGDIPRAQMQANPQPFPFSFAPASGSHEKPVASAQYVGGAPVTATDEPTLNDAGPNPGDEARAQMQAHPEPFPWQG